MLAVLKNLGLTALMVAVATVATSSVAAVLALLIGSAESTQSALPEQGFVVFAVMAAAMLAAVAGVFFCFVTLFVAAVTMPPVIWLTHALKLPRPLADILCGAAAGLLCSAIGMGAFESMARAKGGVVGADFRLVFDLCGLFAGGLLGYIRHLVLVRKGVAALSPPQFQPA